MGSPLEVDLKKHIQKPDYISRISFIEYFHRDFKKIISAYAGDKKVFVFIDDLDRCEVPKAADLMKAINLMISNEPQLIFVIGMDREKVAAGLAVKHERLLPYLNNQQSDSQYGNGLGYGYSFVEKFIQLPFVIPRPTRDAIIGLMDSLRPIIKVKQPLVKQPFWGKFKLFFDVQKYFNVPKEAQVIMRHDNKISHLRYRKTYDEKVRAIMKKKEERWEMIKLSIKEDSEIVRNIVLMVAPIFDFNPRRIKQFINLFRLRAYIASDTGLFDIVGGGNKFHCLTLEQLGKFVAISMNRPSFIDHLGQNLGLFKVLLGVLEKNIENESKYVQDLFKDKKLMDLVYYFPDDAKDFEDTKYSLLYVDMKKLLEISPKVSRGN